MKSVWKACAPDISAMWSWCRPKSWNKRTPKIYIWKSKYTLNHFYHKTYNDYGLIVHKAIGYRNASGVHVSLLVANIDSVICFYFFLKDVFNRYIAVIACSLLLWMLTSANVLGFAAHATQLLTPFVLGGILLFWKGLQKTNYSFFFLPGC